MRLMLLAALLLPALSLAACATAPADTWTRGVKFAPMASAEKAEAAYLEGSGGAAGLYLIRVHIAKGGRIAPHTHPDDRILTVVAGEVWYGFGTTPDTAHAKLYHAGDTFRVPANATHYSLATTSFVVYQEAGLGPTAFTPVK